MAVAVTDTRAQVVAEAVAAEQRLRAAKRMLMVKEARSGILPFAHLMRPHPDDPDNIEMSRYMVAPHHNYIAQALQEVEAGRIIRLIITIPPRHGKSELASRLFPAWYIGRDPYRSMIFATYNDEFAMDFGRDVRELIKNSTYQQIFPGVRLRKGSAASDRLQTTEGGLAVFVGRGGSLTGRGADCLLIDDPIKDQEEADSPTVRNSMWNWFTNVAMTRLMTACGVVVIIMTRWHEDDLVGRLTDPRNPCFDPDIAAQFHILDMPALADDNDVLGRKKGEALWPERFNSVYLNNQKKLNSRGFSALYQGRPSPEDGTFFKRADLIGYRPEELPKNLRYYAASDHAVGEKQQHDRNCLMVVGVDEDDVIWVLPDIYWERSQTDATVERMIDLMDLYEPITWWGENEHIFKSIGPFLFKRMRERSVYCTVEPVSPAKDKMTKAQAIKARISMHMVRFPKFASWWADAEDEMVKFPLGRHDDFVDPLGHIGRGLGRLVAAAPLRVVPKQVPETGTIGWVKWQANQETEARKRLVRGGF